MAFQKLKEYLSWPPIMSSPKVDEVLFAYLEVVHATRKLPHYFQAYTMVVLTQLPLKSILRSADYTGRIAKWGTILETFDIKYMPRTSIKGQVLTDLVVEFAECLEEMNVRSEERRVGKECQ